MFFNACVARSLRFLCLHVPFASAPPSTAPTPSLRRGGAGVSAAERLVTSDLCPCAPQASRSRASAALAWSRQAWP